MPVVVLDTNVIWIMGGHPHWVDESGDRETDPDFLRLPEWHQEEIRALSALNLALPRLYSTAFVPPRSVISELARGNTEAAQRSLRGWGAEIVAWAERWFWNELAGPEAEAIRQDWGSAQTLDLSFLRHEGDRAIARVAYALRLWHSRVLSLDSKSLCRHHKRLRDLGIVVRLPSQLWEEIVPCL